MNRIKDEETANDIKHFKLTFSLDDGQFFRRSCSKCGLHFKEQADAYDLSHLVTPAFKQIEKEHGIILSTNSIEQESDSETKAISCPYCGHVDEPQNMLTDEFSQYFLRWTEREIVYPKIRAFYEGLDETFNRHSGTQRRGLFSIEMKFEHDDVSLPVRPISGPELPDMVKVKLHCCNRTIKIVEGWIDTITCLYCQKTLILQ